MPRLFRLNLLDLSGGFLAVSSNDLLYAFIQIQLFYCCWYYEVFQQYLVGYINNSSSGCHKHNIQIRHNCNGLTSIAYSRIETIS